MRKRVKREGDVEEGMCKVVISNQPLFALIPCQKKNQTSSQETHEKATREKAVCEAHDQKLKGHASLSSREVPTKHYVWQKVKLFYQILYPHYKYLHYPRIVRSAFLRENPSKYTLELEIVIPTIIYTLPLGFPLLLPLYLYILERFLAQTLTIPNLSVE